MPEITDQEILIQFKQPNLKEAAFKQLVLKYQEKLYWQIRRMVTEHENTNDVLQNVLIKVWSYLDGFKGESQLSTWLYRIAYNETISFIQQEKKKNLADWETSEPLLSEKEAETRDTSEEEVGALIEKALEVIPEKQRLVFQMRYYDELSYAEISAALGTSEGALKASYHHAVKKIEEFVKARLNEK